MAEEDTSKAEEMAHIKYYKEKVYTTKPGQNSVQRNEQAINRVLMMDKAVGIVAGYYDDALHILFMSDFFLHHIGYTYEEIMEETGGSFREMLYYEDRKYFQKEVLRKKVTMDTEVFHLLHKDGTPMHVRINKTESTDSQGVPIWVMAVRVVDDAQNLELVNAIIQSGGWYIDFNKDGTVQKATWSREFRHMLGFLDVEEFPDVLESWSDRLHPQDKEQVLQCLFDAALDKTNQKKYITEYRLQDKEGQYHWYKASGDINRRMDGSPSRMVGIFVNIDEEHKTREQNREMDEMLQGIIHLVKQFGVLNFETGEYVLQNLEGDHVAKASGSYVSFVENLVKEYKVLDQTTTLSEILSLENLRKNLQSKSNTYNFEYCSKDEKRFKSLSAIPLDFADNEIKRALFIVQDVTQAKQVELKARDALKEAYFAAKRANQAKTEFLSNMSHDIRTPMNAIIGMTAIAGAHIDDKERVLDSLGKIEQSSRHLLSLINEVLDMSQIEHGKFHLAEEAFELPALIDDIMAIAKPEAEKHKHNLTVRISDIHHESVLGDRVRIQQVMINILGNAVKYTPDGGKITFDICEKLIRNNTVCYEFTIEDTGVGMSEELQKIIFEPFVRADTDRSTKIAGTGLGMPITKNIVAMMNGTIHVESTLGKGSRFTVTLFLKRQEEEEDVNMQLKGMSVLVVDDDALSCESAVEVLQEIGMKGEYVLSGKEALQRITERHQKQEDYFAVIVDWKMPQMNGIDTIREIRDKIDKAIPVIVFTAYDCTEVEKEAREAGANAFLTKPLFRSRLLTLFRNIAGSKDEQSSALLREIDLLKQADFSGKRVLLVEDNAINAEIATEILKMTGVKIQCARDGKQAVELVRSHPAEYFDMVFMDIQMPKMNGYEATKEIRKIPGTEQLPIIAMTANAFTEDVILAKNAGMNEHIAKPLNLTKLNQLMLRWL